MKPAPSLLAAGACLVVGGIWYLAGDPPPAASAPSAAPSDPVERRSSASSTLGEPAAPGQSGPVSGADRGFVFVEGMHYGLPFVGVAEIPGDPSHRYYRVAQKYFKWFPTDSDVAESLVNVPATNSDVLPGQSKDWIIGSVPARNERVSNLLDSVILASNQIQGASLEEVLRYMRQESIRQDPAGKGLEFELRADIASRNISIPAMASATGDEGFFEFQLKQIPLSRALYNLTEKVGLRYEETDYGVAIVAGEAEDALPRLYTVALPVPPDFLTRTGSAVPPPSDPPTAVSMLTSAGVSFDTPGSTATFNFVNSKLIVRHTQQNVDLIESIVMGFACDPTPNYLVDLNSHVIPSMDFQDATIAEVVDFLWRQATSTGHGPDQPYRVESFRDDAIGQRRVSVKLEQVPLGLAIRYFARRAGLDFSMIGDGANRATEATFAEY